MEQRGGQSSSEKENTGRRCRAVGKLKLFLHSEWKQSDSEAVTRTGDFSFSVIAVDQAYPSFRMNTTAALQRSAYTR